MEEERYTLDELAQRTRLKPRTIRHYIQKDLLLGPETLGRGASYGKYHLDRLQVIRELRDKGFTIKQIADYLRLAREIPSEPEPDSTLEFIRARQTEATEAMPASRSYAQGSQSQPPPMPSIGPIELLLERFRNLSGTQRISRRSRGEDWTRLTVTPDLELHVRGPMPPSQLELFEQVADQIRVILLGGDNA